MLKNVKLLKREEQWVLYILFLIKCNTWKVYPINILSSAGTTPQDPTILELCQMQRNSQYKSHVHLCLLTLLQSSIAPFMTS